LDMAILRRYTHSTTRANAPAAQILASAIAAVEAARTRAAESDGMERERGQLIVATNLDDLLERALVTRVISFSRVVQYRAEKVRPDQEPSGKISVVHIKVAEKKDAKGTPDGSLEVHCNGKLTTISTSQRTSGNFTIAGMRAEPIAATDLQRSALQNVILYKALGSSDVRGSCTFSIDQYLGFASFTWGKYFPSVLTSMMSTSPAVFLGCNPLDGDSLLLNYGLLRHVFDNGIQQMRRYAFACPPTQFLQEQDLTRRLEAVLWQEIGTHVLQTFGVRSVAATPERFLSGLEASFQCATP
jgi:hypothetical protein